LSSLEAHVEAACRVLSDTERTPSSTRLERMPQEINKVESLRTASSPA
jgi:hypothetical protein